MVDVSIDMDSMSAQIVTQGRWKEPEDFYRLARPTLTLFQNSLCASMWNPSRLQPFRSKRRRGSALDEKVCSFRRTHPRSAFVKSRSFNSGSFHCISNGDDPESKEISWQRPFSTYFLFIVRSRNSCIKMLCSRSWKGQITWAVFNQIKALSP